MPRKKKTVLDNISDNYSVEVHGFALDNCQKITLKNNSKSLGDFSLNTEVKTPYVFTDKEGNNLRLSPSHFDKHSATLFFRGSFNGSGRGQISVEYNPSEKIDKKIS